MIGFAARAWLTVGWKRRFEDPVQLPRSHRLVTFQDAGNYITRPALAGHEIHEWQAAMLILWHQVGRNADPDTCEHRRAARRAFMRVEVVRGIRALSCISAHFRRG
jgi:hypothetical protein